MRGIFNDPQTFSYGERFDGVTVEHESSHMNRDDSKHAGVFRYLLWQFTLAKSSELSCSIIQVKVQCFRIAIDENGYRTLITNNLCSRSERHGWDQNPFTRLQAERFYGEVQGRC